MFRTLSTQEGRARIAQLDTTNQQLICSKSGPGKGCAGYGQGRMGQRNRGRQ